VLHTAHLLYGRAVWQTPGAAPGRKSCALGTTLTHGDNASSGTSVSLPGRGSDPGQQRLCFGCIALYCVAEPWEIFSSLVLLSASFLSRHSVREGPGRIPTGWPAGVMVCAGVLEPSGATPRHAVRERAFAPAAEGRAFGRVDGPWPSGRSLARVCAAGGARTLRGNADASAASGRPGARRDAPDCGRADGPSRALCRPASGERDSAPTRTHNACPSAMDS